ncbi:hypothetical protein A7979_06420 [Rothia nasimurium]|uniref:Alpha/beta hydrolase n=2 Tax=Rothia nasimurium TaxID=85336 RepID=A0A1Y1RMN3_9MICC|nr:hypothetical protein A7979_06420 [Rothia nasimurium]
MGLGAYVLKGTDGISDIFTTATEDNPFIDEIRAEQVIGQTWRAMKREWGFIAPWMLNGTTQVNNNKFRTSVIISQETSNALVCEGQERLVQDYTGNEENIYLLKDSNHLSLILDKPCVEFIVQVYKGINND